MRVYQTGPVVQVYLKLHMHLTWEKAVAAINEKHQVFTTYRNTQFGINVKRQRGNKKRWGGTKFYSLEMKILETGKCIILVYSGKLSMDSSLHTKAGTKTSSESWERRTESVPALKHTQAVLAKEENTQLTDKAAVRNIRKFHTRKIKLRNHYRYQALLAKLRDSVEHY